MAVPKAKSYDDELRIHLNCLKNQARKTVCKEMGQEETSKAVEPLNMTVDSTATVPSAEELMVVDTSDCPSKEQLKKISLNNATFSTSGSHGCLMPPPCFAGVLIQ